MVDLKRFAPALLSAGLLLLSGIPAFAAGTEEGAAGEGLSGEMSVHLSNYTPGVVRGEGLEKLVEAQEIVDEYLQMHPGVSIEIRTDPEPALEWVVTQLSGGTAPDILSVKNEWAYQYKDNNWFVDLMPYLQEPNPYADGNAKWWDLFFDATLRPKVQSNGALYGLSIDLVATGWVYNKAIFDELGLQVPSNWKEFFEIQATLKDAGYVPYQTPHIDLLLDWTFVLFFEATALDVIERIDTDGSGFSNHEEVARAVRNGTLNLNDPQQQEWLRLLKEWVPNWQSDWAAKTDWADFRLWTTGKAAIAWAGTWNLLSLVNDPLRDFDFGTFWFPPVTTDTSPYGTGKFVRGLGGAHATQLAITATAIEGGKTDLAVDFLRFLTVPERAIPMIEEANVLIPNIKGERSTDLLDGMISSITTEAGPGEQLVFFGFYDVQAGDIGRSKVAEILGGSVSIEEGAAQLQEILEAGVDRMIAANPDWGLK